MTPDVEALPCALCSERATETVVPPRRMLTRGIDPNDPSYTVTVILPDITLCHEHASEVRQGEQLVGWCDDPRCRTYGELGAPSGCGAPYAKVGPRKRP